MGFLALPETKKGSEMLGLSTLIHLHESSTMYVQFILESSKDLENPVDFSVLTQYLVRLG
jgi:hypothetical protein